MNIYKLSKGNIIGQISAPNPRTKSRLNGVQVNTDLLLLSGKHVDHLLLAAFNVSTGVKAVL